MPPIFQDALDIIRFRAKPQEHYVYEWWQPVLWLTVLAILPAATTLASTQQPLGLLLLALGLNWFQALVFTFFFAWWIRKHPARTAHGSLFPVIVLSATAQLSGMLLALAPPALVPLAMLAILFYQFAVLVNALSVSTGVPRKHLVNGLLLYLLVCVLLSVAVMLYAVQAGWIAPPAAPSAPNAVPASSQPVVKA